MTVIGFLSSRSPDDSVNVMAAFHQGLNDAARAAHLQRLVAVHGPLLRLVPSTDETMSLRDRGAGAAAGKV